MATAELDCGLSLRSFSSVDRRLVTDYQQRQLNQENESIKQPQRERVLSHIMANHLPKPMTIFTLPGMRWEFEKQLVERWSHGLRFVCADWSWGVIELGPGHMPGTELRKFEWRFENGRLSGFKTSLATWVWASASSLFHIGRSDLQTKSHRRMWAWRFKKLGAAWLDFTSPLCTETVNALIRFGGHVDMDADSAPVAVTVMGAREPKGFVLRPGSTPAEQRANTVALALNMSYHRRFELTDFWQYESHGGVPMVVVCGMMRRK